MGEITTEITISNEIIIIIIVKLQLMIMWR